MKNDGVPSSLFLPVGSLASKQEAGGRASAYVTEGSWWNRSLKVSWVSFSFEASVKGRKALGSRRLATDLAAQFAVVVDARERAEPAAAAAAAVAAPRASFVEPADVDRERKREAMVF